MKRYVLMGALMALTITFCTTAAQAAPITLDFTAGMYAGANGKLLFGTEDQGVDVSLSTGLPGVLTYDAVSGIGINRFGLGGDNGEVGNDEIVVSGFNPSQFVYKVELAQFFSNEGLFGFHEETGYYRVNNAGPWLSFTANNTDGSYSLILNQAGVGSIAFGGDFVTDCLGILCRPFDDDFSIKSITVEGLETSASAVPEPATMILFGTGLLGAAAQRRRKKNHAA